MAKNRKQIGKRLTVVARKSSDILLSSTPNSEWTMAKPQSVLEVMYPANIPEMEKQAIRSKLDDQQHVYVKEGQAEAYLTRPRSLWTYLLIAFVALALLACCMFGVLILMATVLSSIVANPIHAADQLYSFLNASNSSLAMLEDTLDRTKRLLDIGNTVSAIIKGIWNMFFGIWNMFF